MVSVGVCLLAFLITYLSIPLLRKLAFRFGIVDLPGGRKIHGEVTPLLGGLAVFLGSSVALVFVAPQLGPLVPIIVASSIIVTIGLLDDMRGLSAQFRFIVQTIVTLFLILSGLRISFLPNTLWGDTIEIVLTFFWVVGVTNAFNYLDGLDGLAAGSAIINLFFFSVILYSTGQYPLGLLAISLIGGCCAFLPYNVFKNEKIFLGEAGSTLLGFSLACMGLQGDWAKDNLVRVFIPVLILGVPIFDMVFTTIMRFKEEKVKTVIEWLRYGGKDHFHHYLVDLGLPKQGAVVFIYCLTISLGISAIMVSNDRAIEAWLTLYQAAIIFGVIATLMVVGKRHRSGWQKQ